MGLGRHYFYFVPDVYFYIPFWHCVGLFVLVGILRGMVPTVVSVTQHNTNAKKQEPTEAKKVRLVA